MKNKLSYFTMRSIRKVVEQKGFRFDHISFTVIDGVTSYSIKFYYNKHIKHEIILPDYKLYDCNSVRNQLNNYFEKIGYMWR